jgi:RHS repeat-associated protein
VTDTEGTSLKDRFFGLQWQVFETKAGANTVSRNVWSPAYVDALVLRDRDTDANRTLDERIYPLQDANWNTTGLVNISGTVVERETYGPYGGVTFRDAYGSVISTSAMGWVFLHQGGEKIAAADYEFRNRIYSPTLGRWLSNDPLGFDAGDVNTYRYVGNDPGNNLDPMGLEMPVPSRTYNPSTSKTTPRIPESEGQIGKPLKNDELLFFTQALTYFYDNAKYNRLNEAIADGNVIDPAIDNVKKRNGVMAGNHAFFNGYPEIDSHFGTGGANPCVGVIVISNNNGNICGSIFHFYPGEDGVSAISRYEWKGIKTAYVFGGNNSGCLSYCQYSDLYRFLKKETNGKVKSYEV